MGLILFQVRLEFFSKCLMNVFNLTDFIGEKLKMF